MQPVNFNHASCPKCSATITSGTKTCQSCGAVRYPPPLPHRLFTSSSRFLPCHVISN
ncbi:hypothetical protein BBK36DRAFT_1129665 [Trichoderma citrinoviride]|uniref:Zinc-ribbon domain-containing protein n=1 Tax=Trichoderma citrinoviride TaxID=58853 RepID=A0A2T4AYY1_9HYPO|nr:hypothetical protein BBK36DRAFT_1129665 [Trichoderma citrinoviride]PTB62280.1 hypothetical protein BBK36DRAFT_1129665 [Trichoderma citrinoviride]